MKLLVGFGWYYCGDGNRGGGDGEGGDDGWWW